MSPDDDEKETLWLDELDDELLPSVLELDDDVLTPVELDDDDELDVLFVCELEDDCDCEDADPLDADDDDGNPTSSVW